MLTLRVRYREDDGSVSDRVMTHFVPFGEERFSAFLVSDERMRPAHFDRIAIASDVETGEVIDVRELCGARPLPGPITARPLRRPRPKGKGRVQSSEALNGQRRRDRDEFFNRYRNEIIWNHFRNQLIELFNGR